MKVVHGSIGAFALAGCALFTPQNLPKTEETAKDIACVVEHAFLDDPGLNTVCDLLTPERQKAGHQAAAAHRVGVAKALAAHRASACGPDGGAPEAGAK